MLEQRPTAESRRLNIEMIDNLFEQYWQLVNSLPLRNFDPVLAIIAEYHLGPNYRLLDVNAEKQRLQIAPIHWAVLTDNRKLLEKVLHETKDINVRTAKGESALLLALQTEQFETAKILLKHGVRPDGPKELFLVVRHNYSHDIIDILLQYGAHVGVEISKSPWNHIEKRTLLDVALNNYRKLSHLKMGKKNREEIIKKLARLDIPLNYSVREVLYWYPELYFGVLVNRLRDDVNISKREIDWLVNCIAIAATNGVNDSFDSKFAVYDFCREFAEINRQEGFQPREKFACLILLMMYYCQRFDNIHQWKLSDALAKTIHRAGKRYFKKLDFCETRILENAKHFSKSWFVGRMFFPKTPEPIKKSPPLHVVEGRAGRGGVPSVSKPGCSQ